MREYATAPEVTVYGDPNFTFAYVPSHLHHMTFELVRDGGPGHPGRTGSTARNAAQLLFVLGVCRVNQALSMATSWSAPSCRRQACAVGPSMPFTCSAGQNLEQGCAALSSLFQRLCCHQHVCRPLERNSGSAGDACELGTPQVKNSLRAVNDRYEDAEDEPPPVRVVVAEGTEDVCIKARQLPGACGVAFRAAVNAWLLSRVLHRMCVLNQGRGCSRCALGAHSALALA